MRRLYRKIQSPTALFAFEAAARHQSFTKAAAELNVSQPAISLSVKRIEQALGTQLFTRGHRSIALTAAGERFYQDVSFGLMHILQSAERVAAQPHESTVTISCSSAFAHYWMVPRLAVFKKTTHDIDIRLQTAEKDVEPGEDGVSLAIRRGDGEWPGFHSFLLAREEIFPVCSPAFLEDLTPPGSPEELVGMDLIHLEEPFRPRPTWSNWFAGQGLDYKDQGLGLRLNDYALVLQAAIAGEGVAMGWRHVVKNLIDQGLLTRVLDCSYREVPGFFIAWAQTPALNASEERVLEWLQGQAEPG